MKVLVATNHTQGQRSDDFCDTLEGELVRLPVLVCDCPSCGCERAVEGLASHKATTTFAIAKRIDLDAAGYRNLLANHLVDGGWVVGEQGTPETAWVNEFVELHLQITRQFRLGDVLEVRNDQIRVRSTSSAGRRATG
jgi:hypothetical protein